MTLRIAKEPQDTGTLVRLAGDLSGSELSELEASCRDATSPLTIDLEDVVHADTKGVILLKALASDGARLIGASPYLAMRIGSTHPGVALDRSKDKRHGGRG